MTSRTEPFLGSYHMKLTAHMPDYTSESNTQSLTQANYNEIRISKSEN